LDAPSSMRGKEQSTTLEDWGANIRNDLHGTRNQRDAPTGNQSSMEGNPLRNEMSGTNDLPKGIQIEDWETNLRSELIGAKRILVKVGTSIITGPDRLASIGRIAQIVEQISLLRGSGREIVLVSSGAVGLGSKRIHEANPPVFRQNVSESQIFKRASAAIGQARLMSLYDTLFSYKNVSCSQILLTNDDLSGERIDNLKQTCHYLLEIGVVPILNENDVTNLTGTTAPLIADNDALACRIAGHLNVDLVVLLTDVDGVYTLPPSIPGATVIRTIRNGVGNTEIKLRSEGNSGMGRGGMTAKMDASCRAVEKGVPAIVIASGLKKNTLVKVLAGHPVGTLIVGHQNIQSAKL